MTSRSDKAARDPLASLRRAVDDVSKHHITLSELKSFGGQSGEHVRRWADAGPIEGTAVERYLRELIGITGTLAKTLRCGQVKYPNGDVRPAMLAAVHDLDGTLTAVQTTRLTSDGDRIKLLARRTSGTPGTGTIQLLRPGTVLGIAQTVEDALAATQRTEIPCWAVCDPSRIENAEIPRCIREVHIFANNGELWSPPSVGRAAQFYADCGLLSMIDHCPEPYERWSDIFRRDHGKGCAIAS
jgi:hypothetical protein